MNEKRAFPKLSGTARFPPRCGDPHWCGVLLSFPLSEWPPIGGDTKRSPKFGNAESLYCQKADISAGILQARLARPTLAPWGGTPGKYLGNREVGFQSHRFRKSCWSISPEFWVVIKLPQSLGQSWVCGQCTSMWIEACKRRACQYRHWREWLYPCFRVPSVNPKLRHLGPPLVGLGSQNSGRIILSLDWSWPTDVNLKPNRYHMRKCPTVGPIGKVCFTGGSLGALRWSRSRIRMQRGDYRTGARL